MSDTRTFTSEQVRRYRAAHAKADRYGRHQHLYLHDTMRQLAAQVAAKGRTPTLIDYGCGKGGFIEEMRQLDLFATIAGYDPAVDAFATRPGGRYDIVTCLDVLDVVEPRFLNAVLEDVAQFATEMAVFDCMTKPKPDKPLKPRPFTYWAQIVGQRMRVVRTEMHFLGVVGFERAVIIATPTA